MVGGRSYLSGRPTVAVAVAAAVAASVVAEVFAVGKEYDVVAVVDIAAEGEEVVKTSKWVVASVAW